MEMDDSRFTKLADEMLDHIAEAVDAALGDELDVELQGGILTISGTGLGQYVLNRHLPNREIWLSSPVSGATHFTWSGERWISTRDAGLRLDHLLVAELTASTGADLEI